MQHEARGAQRDAAMGEEVAAVDLLADEGMTGLGEVDADLVGLAGLEADLAQRGVAQALAHRDVGDGALALVGVGGGTAQAVAAIDDELRRDGLGAHGAVGDAQVHALARVIAELGGEALLGALALGEHQQARGGLVDAVHDVERGGGGGPPHAAPGGADQIHGGAGLAVVVRHGRDLGRLVDDDDVGVVVDDVGLAHRVAGLGRGEAHLDGLAAAHAGVDRDDGGAADQHLAGGDPLLHHRPRLTAGVFDHRGQGRAGGLGGDGPGSGYRHRPDVLQRGRSGRNRPTPSLRRAQADPTRTAPTWGSAHLRLAPRLH